MKRIIRRIVLFIVILMLILSAVAAGLLVAYSLSEGCRYQRNQWDVLHNVIKRQNAIVPASPIIVKAFPEFKPFFTPGTPEYKEAQRLADGKRDAAYAELGTRPNC